METPAITALWLSFLTHQVHLLALMLLSINTLQHNCELVSRNIEISILNFLLFSFSVHGMQYQNHIFHNHISKRARNRIQLSSAQLYFVFFLFVFGVRIHFISLHTEPMPLFFFFFFLLLNSFRCLPNINSIHIHIQYLVFFFCAESYVFAR